MDDAAMAKRRAEGASWRTIAREFGVSHMYVKRHLAAYEASNLEPEQSVTGVAGFSTPHVGFRVAGARRESVINPRTGRVLRPPRTPYELWLDRRDGL